MIKYCPLAGCKKKLIWDIKDSLKLIGVCPIHGQVAGIFLFHPLSFIDKVILKIEGYRFKKSE